MGNIAFHFSLSILRISEATREILKQPTCKVLVVKAPCAEVKADVALVLCLCFESGNEYKESI